MFRLNLIRHRAAAVVVLVGTCALVLPFALLSCGPAVSATSQPPAAPYFEMSGPNAGNMTSGITAGLKKVTAAFVIGKSCTPVWDDGVSVSSSTTRATGIKNAQTKGVQVVISFGGASGTDLARSCTSLTKLTAAYQAVITKFKATRIDFDVEGAAISPTAQKTQIARRFSAIRALEKNNAGLVVSVTLPAGPGGLESSGTSFLKVAKSSATRIDVINIMAMDYGSPVADMGAAAISSAKGTLTQVKRIWSSYTYANIGITPMIGQNDTPGEGLTTTQAKAIVSFAKTNHVGWLAFWSLNRDQQCPAGTSREAQDGCSGTTQTARQFTRIFLGL
jgi:chitinase